MMYYMLMVKKWMSLYLTQKIKEAKESGTAPFTPDFNIEYLSSTKSKTVPEGMYFVMGDNKTT